MAINFPNMGNLSGLLGDYATIKSGGYKKLLNAYYSKVEGSKEATMAQFSNKVSKETGKSTNIEIKKDSISEARESADALGVSASTLVDDGYKSVFNKKEVEKVDNATGEKTVAYEYDKEKIKKAVSQFVSDYNAMLDKAAETDSTKVMEKTLSMISNTNAYKKSLENIGISVGSDNKLTINEEKFEAADMTSVKSLFNDSNSFGERTMQKAMQISNEAVKEQFNESLYTNSASYQKKYDISSLLDMYL